MTQSLDVLFDQRLNKRLSKQSGRQWFETALRSLWHHCNEYWHMSWDTLHVCLTLYEYDDTPIGFNIIVLQHFHMMTSWHENAFGTICPFEAEIRRWPKGMDSFPLSYASCQYCVIVSWSMHPLLHISSITSELLVHHGCGSAVPHRLSIIYNCFICPHVNYIPMSEHVSFIFQSFLLYPKRFLYPPLYPKFCMPEVRAGWVYSTWM